MRMDLLVEERLASESQFPEWDRPGKKTFNIHKLLCATTQMQVLKTCYISKVLQVMSLNATENRNTVTGFKVSNQYADCQLQHYCGTYKRNMDQTKTIKC